MSEVPTVEGPITSPTAPFLGANPALLDLAALGYSEDEYFLSGLATAFRREDDGAVVPTTSAPFTTRVLVRRPIDPARCNGSVLVEWLNVSAGFEVAPQWDMLHTEIVRSGYAWVGVSAQMVGIRGGPNILGETTPGLVGTDPERYGSLSHPGDAYSYDLFSQVGRLVRSTAGREALGLRADRVLAVGQSQSAFWLTTYVNAIDPLVQVFDGFLVHARGGGAASLTPGPEGLRPDPTSDVVPFRTDLRVPVLCVESETDLVVLGYLSARQDDNDRFRLWEIAGTSHIDVYTFGVAPTDTGRLSAADLAKLWTPSTFAVGMTLDAPINAGPQHYVVNAALDRLDRWVRDGTAPPSAPRLEMHDHEFERDEHGIARGGVRTPHVDVPVVTLSGFGNGPESFVANMAGSTIAFDAATLHSLYPSRAAYLERFEQATDATVRAGFFLTADAPEIKAVAAEQYPG